MPHKAVFEAMDRTLHDITGKNQVIGGITFALSGDFRQELPVIPQGSHADEMKECIKLSPL